MTTKFLTALLLAALAIMLVACGDNNSAGSPERDAGQPDKGIKPPVCLTPPCPPICDGAMPLPDSKKADATSADLTPTNDIGSPKPDLCVKLPAVPAKCNDGALPCKKSLVYSILGCSLAECDGKSVASSSCK